VSLSKPGFPTFFSFFSFFFFSFSWCIVLLAAGPAVGLTPIDSADLSPDITVELDSQTIADEGVAEDDLVSMSVTTPSLGGLPDEAEVMAYHALGGGSYLFSLETSATLPNGVTARPGDVVRWDGANHSIEFDAAAEGLPAGTRTDAVSVDGSDLVLSFDTTVSLGGGTWADEDLVAFDGVGFSSYFDGSAAGVPPELDVDGAHVFPGTGTLALSFDTSGQLGGVDFDDEDVLEVDPSGPTWEMAWDASVERAGWIPGADVDSVFFVPEPSQLLMLLAGIGLLTRLRSRRSSAR
jgi:hypothetical protein